MQEYDTSQFRTTAWPGLPLPHPALQAWYRYSLGEKGLLQPDIARFLAEVEAEKRGVELAAVLDAAGLAPADEPPPPAHGVRDPGEVAATGEIYLELIELDLDDPEAILAFVNRYGTLGISYRGYALVSSVPGFREHVLPGLLASRPGGGETDALATPGLSLIESLEEFRFGARCLRDLVRAWQLAKSAEEPPFYLEWEALPEDHAAISDELIEAMTEAGQELTSRREAEHLLRELLNAGLAPFHPRLTDAQLAAHLPGYLFSLLPLYAICCLELYNHIVEDAPYRVCANETCKRLFVRQKGRAEHGQHRRNAIKYCTSHCARAQAQREFRQRQRQKKQTT